MPKRHQLQKWQEPFSGCASHRLHGPQVITAGAPVASSGNLQSEVVSQKMWILGNTTDRNLSKNLIRPRNSGDSQRFSSFLTRSKTSWKKVRSPSLPGATGSAASSLGFQDPKSFRSLSMDRHDLIFGVLAGIKSSKLFLCSSVSIDHFGCGKDDFSGRKRFSWKTSNYAQIPPPSGQHDHLQKAQSIRSIWKWEEMLLKRYSFHKISTLLELVRKQAIYDRY